MMSGRSTASFGKALVASVAVTLVAIVAGSSDAEAGFPHGQKVIDCKLDCQNKLMPPLEKKCNAKCTSKCGDLHSKGCNECRNDCIHTGTTDLNSCYKRCQS